MNRNASLRVGQQAPGFHRNSGVPGIQDRVHWLIPAAQYGGAVFPNPLDLTFGFVQRKSRRSVIDTASSATLKREVLGVQLTVSFSHLLDPRPTAAKAGLG